MRKWASAVVVAAALSTAGAAQADGPPAVYSDFAEDGALSCGHSRSALKATLNDASIHQYGDPLTFLQLKLAIRKQLAGGCRVTTRAVTSTDAPRDTSATAASGESRNNASAKTDSRPKPAERPLEERPPVAAGD